MLVTLLAVAVLVGGGANATGCAADTGDSCVPKRGLDAEGVCTLSDAKANAPLALQIMETCYTDGAPQPSCSVRVTGTTIELSLDGEVCTARYGTGVPARCGGRAQACAVPALAPGTYTLRVNGRSAPLTVSAAGTQAACDLLKKPTWSAYSKSCRVDADCTAVAVLDYPADPAACPLCACPNTAIATADRPKFEEDAKNARSHCLVATATASGCGADCAKADAFCDAGACALRK